MHHRYSEGSGRGVVRRTTAGPWVAFALLGALACGDGSMDPESESFEVTDEPELEPDGAPPPAPSSELDAAPHHPDVPDVTVYWAERPEGIERAASLTLVAESFVDEPREVEPRVLVEGLDERTAELELERFELGPHERVELSIRLDELPVQGISHSVTLLASGTYEGALDPSIAVQAEPLAFHFDDGYAHAYVYTLDTMVTELDGGSLVDDPRELRGRVQEGGGYTPVTGRMEDDAIPAGLASIEYTYEISTPEAEGDGRADALGASTEPQAGLTSGGGDGGTMPPPDLPPLLCLVQPWNCCTGDACVDVCADWTTSYVDASSFGAVQKEDHGLGSVTQVVDASYAEFDVTKTTCNGLFGLPSTVETGLLGPDGCAMLDLPSGSGYGLKVKTRLQQGVTGNLYPVEHHPDNDPATNVGVVTLSKSFTVPPLGSPLPPPMIVLPLHPAANAAAALSRMLASGIAVDQPSGFTTSSGLGCDSSPGIPSTDACVQTTVRTGPYATPGGSPGGLRWKFILAHEYGHMVQKKAIGSLWNPYCFTPGGALTWDCAPPNLADPPGAPASCRCDHVSGSNGLHCLQSLEYTSTAQLEGYAQFFAARVWNDADGGCLFRYYKQFRSDRGLVIQPPVNVSCSDYVGWRDDHCSPSTNGGTEYDWLQFLWNLHAAGSWKYSMHEIFDVYRGACSGGDCTGEGPQWDDLESSAATLYGTGSAKHLKLVLAGSSASVDEP